MKIKNLTHNLIGGLALLTTLIFLAPNAVHAAPFTPGNLVVYRSGDGSAALGNSSTAAFLVEYTTSGGTPVQTIALPIAVAGANQPLTCSGSATSEGFISRSTDGAYITCVGYNAVPGIASIATSTTTTATRGIGRVDSSGNIDTTTALTDAFSGGNIRSVASTDGSAFWVSGNNTDPRYAVYGATTSTLLSTAAPNNTRALNIFNGQLYNSFSSTTMPGYGVAAVGTGLPTTSGQTFTLLPGFPTSGTHSHYGFWFKDANTLYVADDGSAANGGGIQKWTLSGGTWTLAYNLLNNGTATTACRGLTGTVLVNGTTILYATTTASAANTLISVTDTGSAGSPAAATVLATAPAFTAFRGVAFGPVPPLMLSATANPVAGSLTKGVNNQPVFGFQLTPTAITAGFTTLALTTTGTATSSDMNTFQVVEDVNGNGVYDPGTDTIVSSAAQPLSGTINFNINGEGNPPGFTAAKAFLVIANLSATATAGHTFTGSIAVGGAGTTPAAAGSAMGNLQTIGIDMTMSAVASSESATISSLVNDASPLSSTSGAQVWQVLFSNPSGGLGAGTISALTFTKGAGNTVADWSTTILAADLFDGGAHLASGTIAADNIAFSGLSVVVADGGSKTLTLRISLVSTPTLTDNASFQFALANSGVTSSGNGVITLSINSAAGQNKIDVVATKLAFTTPNPSSTYYAIKNVAFNGIVQAQDVHGNLDANYTSLNGVGVTKATGPGTFTYGGAASILNGQVSWLTSASQGFSLSAVGDYTLTATDVDSVLTAATSGTITVENAATLTAEVVMPQYMEGNLGSTNRLPFAYCVTLGSLLPNATYRYYNLCVSSADASTIDGAGNFIVATSSGNFVWVNSASVSFSTPGTYGTFTTDNTGSYTGWFIAEPTGNARFATGNQVYMQIMLNNGADGTFVFHRVRSTTAVNILSFGTDSASGTGIYGNSYATPKNFVLLYDNTAGTGRPLAATFVEDDGEMGSSYVPFYPASVNAIAGAWGTIIPNGNSSGVRRIEQRALSNGSVVVLASTDADGTWPSGAVTASPSAGWATPLHITATDAPLGVPLSPATITAIVNNNNGTGTITFTGAAGQNFRIVASPTLTAPTWSPLTPDVTDTSKIGGTRTLNFPIPVGANPDMFFRIQSY